MPILMKLSIDGTHAEGPSEMKGYEKYCELDSISYGITVPVAATNSANRVYGRAELDPVTVSKSMDGSSVLALQAACKASKCDVELAFLIQDGDDYIEHLLIKLHEVLIGSHSLDAGAEGEISESMTLNYTSMDVDYTGQKDETGPGVKQSMSWDTQTVDKKT